MTDDGPHRNRPTPAEFARDGGAVVAGGPLADCIGGSRGGSSPAVPEAQQSFDRERGASVVREGE